MKSSSAGHERPFAERAPLAALIVNAGAGLLVGMSSSAASFLGTWALYALVGAAYGVVCWPLARRGWLAFPNE